MKKMSLERINIKNFSKSTLGLLIDAWVYYLNDKAKDENLWKEKGCGAFALSDNSETEYANILSSKGILRFIGLHTDGRRTYILTRLGKIISKKNFGKEVSE